MEAELKVLIELQKVDQKLIEVKQSLGELPQMVSALREKIGQLDQELQNNRTQLENHGINRRRLEREVSFLEEKLKKYKNQLYAVTTNKEYDAVTSEIDNTQRAIDEAETHILEHIEAEEQLQEKIKKDEETWQSLSAQLKEREEELDKKLKESQKAESLLTRNREQLIARISRPLLSNYERIRKGKDGLAVVPVVNGSCSGCFSHLPPQTVLEVKKMNQLIVCDTCGRILFWKGNGQDLTL